MGFRGSVPTSESLLGVEQFKTYSENPKREVDLNIGNSTHNFLSWDRQKPLQNEGS
jgi:hypothetical protein